MSLCAIHQSVTLSESCSLVILFQPKGGVAEPVMTSEGTRQCVAQCLEVPALDALGVRGMGWWKSERRNWGDPPRSIGRAVEQAWAINLRVKGPSAERKSEQGIVLLERSDNTTEREGSPCA
jgi:hypothetical protein